MLRNNSDVDTSQLSNLVSSSSPNRVFPEERVGSSLDAETNILRAPQVLIVDDSSANRWMRQHRLLSMRILLLLSYHTRKILRRMIESKTTIAVFGNCTIVEADDGRTALDVMRSEMEAGRTIQLVLMDFIMVHMNGPEAAQKMRAE